MEAVNNNDLDTVKLLVERGADPSKVVNNAVGNALELSEGEERIAIQAYFVEHGARHSKETTGD
jgi:ankyrin repeat protein